jgi:hypothetical protein
VALLQGRITLEAQWRRRTAARGPVTTSNARTALASDVHTRYTTKELPMLWTLFTILLILWLLGVVTSYTLGGFIHILLVLAIVAVLIRLIQGRTPVT